MKPLSIFFLLLLALTGWAITPEEIIDIKERAENGKAEAQHYLGVMYYLGDGVTKDTEEGTKWSKKTALQGNIYAAHNLGITIHKGIAVPVDLQESVKWLRMGAENGYVLSQDLLGSIYLSDDSLKDHEEALKWFKMGAEQGNANSLYSLGWLYSNSEGIKDDAEAVKWYRKAAEQGNVESQTMMGRIYRKGRGVEKDNRQGAIWYRMAAANGSGDAALYLSVMFYVGEGVIKDIVLAHVWASVAAINNSPKASKLVDLLRDDMTEENLSESSDLLADFRKQYPEMFVDGITERTSFIPTEEETERIVESSLSGNTLNLRIDEKTHFEWMQEDAFKNDPFAQLKLGECYEEGFGVEASLTDAMKWYMIASMNGLEEASKYIQLAMDKFEFDEQSMLSGYLAKEWLREHFPTELKELTAKFEEKVGEEIAGWKEAAENGEVEAQDNLGEAYFFGNGVLQDYKEGVKWFRKAAEQGFADAQQLLGFAYQYGLGVPEDYKESVKWVRKAAEQRFAGAQFKLGYAYEKGSGVPEDDEEAFKWYRKAAEQGHASAQYDLGLAYFNGAGVPEDHILAYAWWNIAATNGEEQAREGKEELAELMTKEQIAKAQDLSREMIKANPKLMGD